MARKSKGKGSGNRQAAERIPAPSVAASAWLTKPVVHLLIVAILAILIYANTLHAPFVLDDLRVIVNNPAIRDLDRLFDPQWMYGNRYVGLLSFALNHEIHGLGVAGYHAVNLLVHLLAALSVYWLLFLTFQTPLASAALQGDGVNGPGLRRWIPLFTALLFVSHPIQTQAVVYIVQRFASLATLFYLLSLILYIKARGSESSRKKRYAYYAASLAAAVLAMRTKEIAFTLPLMVMVYEFLFFTGDVRKRMLFLVLMLATLFLIPLSMVMTRGGWTGIGAAGLDELTKLAGAADVSRWDYLNTQFRVIATYIRLLFLPVCQNLDYDYPIYRTFFDPPVFLSFLLILALLCGGIYLLYRSLRLDGERRFWLRLVAFGIIWFFATLSVESSIIPIADVIFEHRLYLPSIGCFMALLAGMALFQMKFTGRLKTTRAFIWILIPAVAVLSLASLARNTVWRDDLTLWEDTARKSPNKLRPRQNLGEMYQRRGLFEDAIREYRTAIRIRPDHPMPHNNLGMVYQFQGRLDDAIREYRTAIQLKPDFPLSHQNLGAAYQMQGRLDDAIREYRTAIQLKPDDARSHHNLGMVYRLQGRLEDAIGEFRTAVTIDPAFADARSDLGAVYHAQGRLDDAVREYRAALEIQPDHVNALKNLDSIQRRTPRP